MTSQGCHPYRVEITEHIACLRGEGELLAKAAEAVPLWNRGSAADGIDVSGDADVLTVWRDRLRVRWS